MMPPVVILAGGMSSRTSTPKMFLRFNNNLTFVEHILYTYAEFKCSELVLVLNKNFFHDPRIDILQKLPFSFKLILNENPAADRCRSLLMGLDRLAPNHHCFFQNVDNPFVDKQLLQQLFDARFAQGYVRPVHNNKGGHPVLLSKAIVEKFKKEARDPNLNIKQILAEFPSHEVESEKTVLANINSLKDYKQYFNQEISA